MASSDSPRCGLTAGPGWLNDQLTAVIPVLPDGAPDRSRRTEGARLRLNRSAVELELQSADQRGCATLASTFRESASLMLLFCGELRTRHCAALRIIETVDVDHDALLVRCTPGGIGQAVLDPLLLTPRFDPERLTFRTLLPETVLRQWEDVGVLHSRATEGILVCPRCRSIPVLRRWCQHCHSSRVDNDDLMHHQVCGYVGQAAEFTCGTAVACPSCGSLGDVPQREFQSLRGAYRCKDCHWQSSRSGQLAECLQCSHRCSLDEAVELMLKGYRADRIDLLALMREC